MSGFQAIAGVSATLRNLLRDRMEDAVNITIAPPDVSITGMTGRRVNLYLYHIAENPFLKNQDRLAHPGEFGRPPLSLNLHYLVTGYGSGEDVPDGDLQAQQSLGDAARVFHDFPVITDSLHENDNPADPLILDPSLLGEVEKIKITLRSADLDEFSKIWTALPQANFRRSMAYEVSLVQIASARPRTQALPVRERRVYAFPLKTPFISEIVRDPLFDNVRAAIAEIGDTILILGYNLRGQGTRVVVGAETQTPATPQDTRIAVTVPLSLSAGVHAVQVIHDLLLFEDTANPPVPHRGSQSNAVPLLVLPRLVSLAPAAGAAAGATVTATVDPPVTFGQTKSLLLGDYSVQAEPMALNAPPSTTIRFVLPEGAQAIPPGAYLVRVRVDGAESRLSTDPATLQYTGPLFNVV